ncbi:MAG: aspartate-semialdehyde dehydrogenase [Gammaproteobacteria bacterium]|nr:aspartate-semialdehyde dehydrogenase [Gammaproteobacteria bacterium]
MSKQQGKWDVAVVGATGLVGGAVLELLARRNFPIGQLYPLASENSEGKSVEYGDHRLTVHLLDNFDFRNVQLALFCVPSDVAKVHIPEASQAGCTVIDFSDAYRLDPAVPLVVAEVNPHALAEVSDGSIIASPDSSIIQCLLALHPLHQRNPLERINAVFMRAVSELGQAGIDELSSQSIALFNMKEMKSREFSQQIAFNVLAQSGGKKVKDGAKQEYHLQQELQKILEDPDIGMNVTATQVPVFFGHSAALHIEFKDKFSTEQAQKLFGTQTRIRLVNEARQARFATAVSHAANDENIYISRLREDPSWDRGLNMWVVSDNIRTAANNGVLVAETLVKDYL